LNEVTCNGKQKNRVKKLFEETNRNSIQNREHNAKHNKTIVTNRSIGRKWQTNKRHEISGLPIEIHRAHGENIS
jgi:hypothetical protein